VTLGVTTFATEPAATVSADTFANATSGSTITLMNKEDWKLFAAALAGGNTLAGVNIKIGADVTFNENMDAMALTENSATTGLFTWTPYAFNGTLDGLKTAASGDQPAEYYTISGLYLNGGLFAHTYGNISNINFENCYSQGVNYTTILAQHLRGATIENVHMTNCHVVGVPNTGGYSMAGGFTAMPFAGTAKGCSFNGKVESGTGVTSDYNGGIVGQAISAGFTVENCVNYGTIIGKLNAGGLVGHGNAGSLTVRNSENRGAISGSTTGGIVGYSQISLTVTNTKNMGEVTGTGNSGGLVGYLKNAAATFTACDNENTVASTGTDAGGFIGRTDNTANTVKFDTCKNTAAVSGRWVGGFIGENYYSVNMDNCMNSGTITATSWAGGLFGRVVPNCTVTVDNSVNLGSINATNAGGIFGYSHTAASSITLTSCLNVSDKANVGALNGGTVTENGCVALTPAAVAEMSAAEMMSTLWSAGFDFDEKWHMTAEGAIPAALFDGEKAKPDTNKEIVYKGYQLGLAETEEAGNIRFISGMNNIEGYKAVGFELIITDAEGTHAGDENGNPLVVNDTVVYTSLRANGVADAITAANLQCEFLSAVTITGLSANAVVELTATLTDMNDNVVRGTTVMIVIENGAVVAQYAI